MTSRHIDFYAFCSIKGGVGKSTLAVATAKLLAADKRVPVLVDADLTGTSLADGLNLCAPKIAMREDGAMDLDVEPTGEHWSKRDTDRLRNQRKAAARDPQKPNEPPPYLNDALLYEARELGEDCRIDAMLWKHESSDGVLYLPSSPLIEDVRTSVAWLWGAEPFQWVRRFAWLLNALLVQRQDVTDVIVDLPPGVLGFTHETLVFMAGLASGGELPQGYPQWAEAGITWRTPVRLVTTHDWNDLLPALEYMAKAAVKLPALSFLPLVNKLGKEAIEGVRREVRARLDPQVARLDLDKSLRGVDELRTSLGQLFRGGDLPLSDDVYRLRETLLEENAR